MTKPRKPEMQWYSPQALANRADDGFLFLVRSTATLIDRLPSGMAHGVSKVGQVLAGRKETIVRLRIKPLETVPPRQDASLSAAESVEEREGPCPDAAEAAELIQSARPEVAVDEPAIVEEAVDESTVVDETAEESTLDDETQSEPTVAAETVDNSTVVEETAEEPALDEKTGTQHPPQDMETLLKEHSPQDTAEAIKLRKALDDLLHGSEEAGAGALETLVGLGQAAEPLLVACLQTDSPPVAEIALEGLSLIGSKRLVDSISDVLGSSDTELRLVALRAAGRLPDDEQQPLIGQALWDPSASVRRHALSCVARNDSYWALAEANRLCDDKDPDVQWAAVEALMALRPSEAHCTLRLMIPSLTPAYQRRAAILLEQQKDQGASLEETEEQSKQPSGDGKEK